jgi:hypothetical protein
MYSDSLSEPPVSKTCHCCQTACSGRLLLLLLLLLPPPCCFTSTAETFVTETKALFGLGCPAGACPVEPLVHAALSPHLGTAQH